MDPLAKLVADIVGPVLGDLAAELRAEIKEVRDLDREQIAMQIAEHVDCFSQKRCKELEARIIALEKRFQTPRRVA